MTLVLPDGLPAELSRSEMAEALKLKLATDINKMAPGPEPTIAVAHIVAQAAYHDGASEEALLYAMLATINGQAGFLSSAALTRIFRSTIFRFLRVPRIALGGLPASRCLLYLRREITQLLEPLAQAEHMSAHTLVQQLVVRERTLLTGKDLQHLHQIKGGGVPAWLDSKGMPYIQIAYRDQLANATFSLAPTKS